MTTTVSFPGLGIGEFEMNKVAFSIGNVRVHWYGILITLGFVLAFLYVTRRAKKSEGIPIDHVFDTGLLIILLSIIGARLYYVLTSLDQFESFWEVFQIWKGGLAIYGGVLGGALAIFIMCRVHKTKMLRFYDATVPAVILAQAIGRWGNFVNGEAHGYPIVSGTSSYFFFTKEFQIPAGSGPFAWFRMGLNSAGEYHPTFLYESVWNLLGFALLNLIYRKKKFNGQILLFYLAWYGFGRMLIEGLRTDSLYIFGSIRISQLVGLLCFLIGTALLIWIPIYRKKHPDFLAYEKPLPAPAAAAPAETPAEQPVESTEQPAEPVEQPAEPVEQPAEPVEQPVKEPEEPAKPKKTAAKKPAAKPKANTGRGAILPVARKKRKPSAKKKPAEQGEDDHATN